MTQILTRLLPWAHLLQAQAVPVLVVEVLGGGLGAHVELAADEAEVAAVRTHALNVLILRPAPCSRMHQSHSL